MKPIFHPHLVNNPFGDPALYIDFLFEKRAMMFDLGDISVLAPRKILRLSHIFASHTHMDHFMGFDRIVRICIGRGKCIHLFGPENFVDQVGHKLAGYTWNLVRNYETDFTIIANEYHEDGKIIKAQFHCQQAFRKEHEEVFHADTGILLEEDTFLVRAVHLDHKIPCLAFALEEKKHINVWKNRLDETGLPTGAWLRELKAAVLSEKPDDLQFRAWWKEDNNLKERYFPLGELKDRFLEITPGQIIAYVVDTIYHEQNINRIVELARDADMLFIEACFLQDEIQHAAKRYHLTTHQAGTLGNMARVKRIIPFHFSARHLNNEATLRQEVSDAFLSK